MSLKFLALNKHKALTFEKKADLYFNKVYTVVSKEFDFSKGILPEDQGFSDKYVLVWGSYKELNTFNEDKWKKISIVIPEDAKKNDLVRKGGNNVYAMSAISPNWKIEEMDVFPMYEE